MENGASLLKKLGIIFLCIGTLGVSGSMILCFIVPSLWLFSIIFGSVLAVFLIVGIICMIIYSTKKGKKEKLIANGKYIYADIVDIDVNVYQKVQIDRISMNPYFIVCKYVEANGKEHLFKSKSLLYNPSALITEKQLKVYVDLKNPKTNRKNAGFTDEERGKMTELLNSGFIDTYRYFEPNTEGVYSWWSYRFKAREKNAGWRIDYYIVSDDMKDRLEGVKIHTEVFGSDHCPVELDIR